MKKSNRYFEEYRLADVIRLIVSLAIEENSFRTFGGVESSLRSKPKSAENWSQIADEHPEFFRFNKGRTSITLLFRYLRQPNLKEGEKRDPLSVKETQKLIDQAIEIHDRQIARHQRNSFRIPIITTLIVALVTLLTAAGNIGLTIYKLNKNELKIEKIYNEIKDQNEEIKETIKGIEKSQYEEEAVGEQVSDEPIEKGKQ